MPSGYTAKLYEGTEQSFAEFAIECAHAFGALVTMRDGPMDAPIPEFTVSEYEREAVTKAEARYRLVLKWDDHDAQVERDRLTREHDQANVKADQDATAKRARYEAMLAQVLAWVPPTPDHQGLKEFMADQLRESIKFDCGGGWISAPLPEGAQYRTDALTKARDDLARAKERLAEEVERVTQRNNWVRLLRESLAQVSV